MDKLVMEIPYFQVPNTIFDLDIDVTEDKKDKQKDSKKITTINRKLKVQEKLIYIYLCRCANQGKKAFPSLKTIANKCGIGETAVKEAINILINNNLIIKNKRFKDLENKISDSNLYELLSPENAITSRQPTRGGSPPDTGVSRLPTRGGSPSDNYKELSIKNYINNIYTAWNAEKIIEHKKLTEKIEKAITTSIKDYKEEEIVQAITNYKKILTGTDYYFNYRWTLEEFLKRGLEKFLNWGVCSSNFKNKTNNFNPPPSGKANAGAYEEI